MRALLAVLVLANLLAFAWWQGWLEAWSPQAGTAVGRPAEIAPERLVVVPLERLEAGASSGGAQPAPIPAAGEASGTASESSASSASSVNAGGAARVRPAAGAAPDSTELPPPFLRR
ncbi:hypothetical protein [Quisquiliibacterium transsilvanicum]|uniref:Sporulation protein n=1 Tax=Quisquiliibacterium transsilvanicum TaxID=1549638 RepID=A0A7W8HIE5_9BURK|nr:hypothetical protein [Quisquiliibacterium transsilvanicum]MBB5272493.1 hypothetical protein [Quisquiliibacterium transsilvanicum]